MMTPFIKCITLSWQEKRCLLLTFIVLHIIRLGLWQSSFQSLWQCVQSQSFQPPSWMAYLFPVSPPITEWVHAIDIASWYTLKQARCLSRALTLYLLMKWCGYCPTLRIGVAKSNAVGTNPDADFGGQQTRIEAHAWVEHNEQVILGQIRDLERFTVLPSIEPME